MVRPYFFSWLEESLLAGCAWPGSADELSGLRADGVDIVVTLTEEPLPKSWIDSAGLMSVHVPVPDMDAPQQEQIDQVMAVVEKARASGMGVVVHCLAGRGRTGTILAAYLVTRGHTTDEAVHRVRSMRPGSIEVREQVEAIREFERRIRRREREV